MAARFGMRALLWEVIYDHGKRQSSLDEMVYI
jgi:hypothetical protein